VFAAICGWLTSASTISPDFAAGVSILLTVVLFLLYVYFMLLLGMLRIFTGYLIEKYDSEWEKDWTQYRNDPGTHKYAGYSVAGKWVFLLLGLLSFLYPCALLWLRSSQVIFYRPLYAAAAMTILYLLCVWLVTGKRELFFGTKPERHWRRILKNGPH
jgi:hypothetical protein